MEHSIKYELKSAWDEPEYSTSMRTAKAVWQSQCTATNIIVRQGFERSGVCIKN